MNDLEKEEYIAYIKSRKSSFKENYYKLSLKEIERYKKENPNKKPTILLHCCCMVCGCWPIDFLLNNGFEVTVMYNNSNIWPKSEYDHRLKEITDYIHNRYHDNIKVIITDYDYDNYKKEVLNNRMNDPEGWKSCFKCYATRMNEAFKYADNHNYDYFTTVMTFSRQKDSQKLNEIGMSLAKQYSNTKYFTSDFKKANGALVSKQICEEYNIYHQNYCGCEYSYQERMIDEKESQK